MPVELRIIGHDDGRVEVSGVIQNKMLAYGLLAMARDAIQEFHAKAAERRIVPASSLPPNGLLKG